LDPFWGNIFRHNLKGQSVVQFLAQIPIFSGLKTRELKALERIVHLRRYKSAEVLFRKDDPGVGMYIVRSGAVRIVIYANSNGSDSGAEIELARLEPGDFFGEASLADGGPRSATAIVDGETSLIGLFRPDLLDLCQRDQSTGLKVLWNICEVLSLRLRSTNIELMGKGLKEIQEKAPVSSKGIGINRNV
jgi:CRP-like cAMP-binding protein